MSGETEKQVSGWTTDTLHEHVDTLLRERDLRYAERFDAQEKAVLVSSEQTQTRFENVNEWRQTVTDLINSAMPRRESDARWSATVEKINAVAERVTTLEGMSGGKSVMWAYVVGGVGFAVAIITVIVTLMNLLTSGR